MIPILSDTEAMLLIQNARRGATPALTRLYELYADRVFRFVRARIIDAGTAEDLAADVFVSVVEKLDTFRPGAGGTAASLTGWIFTIARNRVIDYQRQSGRRPTVELPDEQGDELLPSHFKMDAPQIESVDLYNAIRNLTEEQQSVILLRFQQDLTFGQIAQTLGKTEEAVKALQRRALASLARLLAEPYSAEQV
ncbi:MAG TPA: sigma-70 family RNA polymerase sigma factor [Anaerolineae bacterium]